MAKQNKFGTFGGVFVPSILTILGVIMYLRLPMIIGEVGLWAALAIIVVAHIISITTGLSVSSIATDKKVEAGGTYFMISRSLGLPIGGTLGLALFVGLSFSVSLYLIGFSESFLNFWGFEQSITNIRLTGTIILVAVTTLTFISTSLAIKTQYFILAAIVLSLISILFGSHSFEPAKPLLTNPASTVSLMVMFGIFFPAVTGFEAGVSMSGDLKDPKTSIPTGTIMAITVGFVVYIALAFFFAFNVSGEALRNPEVLLNISWIPELVIAGIWGATLSSALGSILGAPRILQATAVDRITPKVFGKGYGPTNEPRNALLLTFLIAEVGILIGELNVIARIVSIFFITTYGFLNLSASFERWTSADFRPDFKVPGWISLLGAIACFLVMIQLDFLAMLGATVILGALYFYLKQKELRLESGDAWSGVWASLVKTGLTNLKRNKLHNRNWRPNTIMFTGNPTSRSYMLELGKAFSGKLGLLSSFELILSDQKILTKSQSSLTEGKDANGYFSHVLHCRDVYEGIDQIARVYGFSGVEPNTILMGWTRQDEHRKKFTQLLEGFRRNHYNSIILNYHHERKFGSYRTIDVWWSGTGRNLSLAINLVRNLGASYLWKQASVRLLIINPENDEEENVYNAIEAIFLSMRVDAKIKVVNNEISPDAEHEIYARESGNADLTIFGVPDSQYQNLDNYYDRICQALDAVGSALVINASDNFEEYEVISSDSRSKVKVDKEAIQLPPLELSTHSEIATNIRKIDFNGNRTLDILFKKSFGQIINHRLDLLGGMENIVGFIRKELADIEGVPDFYRKSKMIGTLKSQVFFKLNALLSDTMKESLLVDETKELEEVLTWYQQRLYEDFTKYPSRLPVKYSKDEYKTQVKQASLGATGRWKLFAHWLTGKPITHLHHFREIARHYQLHRRRIFLHKLLHRFGAEETAFYKDFRRIVNRVSQTLDQWERNIWHENKDWKDQADIERVAENITIETDNQKQLLFVYQGRLIVEFRRNLQLMNNDLEDLQSIQHIRKNKRSTKYYKELQQKTTDFPIERELRIKSRLNMILMELSVNATKNRIEEIQDQFQERLRVGVESHYLRPIEKVESILQENQLENLSAIKILDDFKLDLEESFHENMERITKLSESMPDSLEIYSFKHNDTDQQETMAIPVARMAEYYLTSQYEVLVEERFDDFMEYLNRSIYTTKDLLNLSQFSFDSTEENTRSKKELIAELDQKLKQEKENVTTALGEFIAFDQDQLDVAFEPLSSTKIEESANDFVAGLRTYQGKKVLTGLASVTQKISDLARNVTTRLFYSRSEGILMAKKLGASKALRSNTSQLLALKEKVSPMSSIIKSLPPYYVTLFMGKSNIGNDFWIERKEEEALFKKALARFRQGYGGGILVLGERNYGKTAFSKEVLQEVRTGDRYAVFPPVQGSASPDSFDLALRKATELTGNAEQVCSRLKPGSVVIINDLELFWERSAEGLAVVEQLQRLIDSFGQRILFVVNINPHAFRIINQLTPLGDRFLEIVHLTAFDAMEIRDLIMKRHRSSGLSVGFKEEETINEVSQALLFNHFFDYSEGNPGTALNGWLANIQKHTAGSLVITKPTTPSLNSIKELNEDWTMLLQQFVLHKRLTVSKIKRISDWDRKQIISLLRAMLRSGLIQEKATGVYHLHPFVHPFIVRALKEKEVLQ